MSAVDDYRRLIMPGNLRPKDMADAAIDECLEEIERLKPFEAYEVFTADDGEPATRPVNWPARVAELEAENERLKVCGNCKWFRAEEYQYCGHPEAPGNAAGYEYYISAPDKCDFTTSRWETRP